MYLVMNVLEEIRKYFFIYLRCNRWSMVQGDDYSHSQVSTINHNHRSVSLSNRLSITKLTDCSNPDPHCRVQASRYRPAFHNFHHRKLVVHQTISVWNCQSMAVETINQHRNKYFCPRAPKMYAGSFLQEISPCRFGLCVSDNRLRQQQNIRFSPPVLSIQPKLPPETINDW